MTHITADDLEIDVRDTTQLEKVRAEMVRRHENDLERAAQRIAELETQLATEREAKMHETERDAASEGVRALLDAWKNLRENPNDENHLAMLNLSIKLRAKYLKDGEK